jgi:putative tributyrin esterase
VFYYLHGLGGNETNWTSGAKLDAAANTLGLQAIVVMPDGDDAFYVNGLGAVDYDKCLADGTGMFMPGHEQKQRSCVKKRAYDTYITSDLVKHVDTTYRTIATREGRAIAGLSMGGFGALQLSMRHTDLYAAAASHSGLVALLYNGPVPYQTGKAELLTDVRTWGGPFVEIRNWMLGLFGEDVAHWRSFDPAALVATLAPGKLALYVDCGTDDLFQFHNHAAYLHDLLVAKKIDHEYFIGAGGHDFRFWKARVGESLRFLRDHTTKPN